MTDGLPVLVPLTSEQIKEQARATYGEVVVFEHPSHGLFIFKKPSRPVWSRFQQQVNQPKADLGVAFDNLTLACMVHPEGEGVAQRLLNLYEEYPAASTEIGGDIAKLATGGEALRLGKR